MFVGIVFLLFSIVALAFYCYEKNTSEFFRACRVPFVKPIFPFGVSLELFKVHYRDCVVNNYAKLKDKGSSLGFGVVFIFWRPIFIVTSLEFLKHIFVTDIEHFYDHSTSINQEVDPLSGNLVFLKGEQWKRMKAKIAPAFTPSKLKWMSPLIEHKAENLKELISKMLDNQDSAVIECMDLFARYTTDVIGAYAFGLECNSLREENAEFRRMCKDIISDKMTVGRYYFCAIFRELSSKLKVKIIPKYFADFFHGVITDSVMYREKNNIQRKDLLDNLIKIRRKEELSTKEALNMNDGKISLHEITALCMGFMIAGSESSSNAIALTIYELSKNQMLQNKARESVKKVLQRHDGKFTFDALSELTYLGQCINETLRMYPPVGVTSRRITKDFVEPQTGFVMEEDSVILIPIYAFHMDPEYFPNPEAYDPERFSPENAAKNDLSAYMPFGGGNRFCPGQQLSKLQMKMALANILLHFLFHPHSIASTVSSFSVTKAPAFINIKVARV